MKNFKQYTNINESRNYMKLSSNEEWSGRKPFIIDENTGELYKTTEGSSPHTQVYYLTYQKYMILKEYSENIMNMISNLEEQKQVFISKLKNNVIKVYKAGK